VVQKKMKRQELETLADIRLLEKEDRLDVMRSAKEKWRIEFKKTKELEKMNELEELMKCLAMWNEEEGRMELEEDVPDIVKEDQEPVEDMDWILDEYLEHKFLDEWMTKLELGPESMMMDEKTELGVKDDDEEKEHRYLDNILEDLEMDISRTEVKEVHEDESPYKDGQKMIEDDMLETKMTTALRTDAYYAMGTWFVDNWCMPKCIPTSTAIAGVAGRGKNTIIKCSPARVA
jgi:hypothetical protein